MENQDSNYFKPFHYLLLLIGGFLISILIIMCYEIIINYLSVVKDFFQFFEKTSELQKFLITQITTLNLAGFTLFFAILFAFFYLLAKISNEKIMIWESDDIHAKYFQTFLLVLSVFNYILLLPLIWFLWVSGGRFFELTSVIVFYLISISMVFLFQQYGALLNNFTQLKKFRKTAIEYQKTRLFLLKDGNTTLLYFIRNLAYFSKLIIVLMFLTFLFGLILNFNLLTIFYFEMTFLFWYFIICSIAFIPIGTVNIFFNSGMILNDVFITEDSKDGYIITLESHNQHKKIMKSAVKFIEPSDSDEKQDTN